MDYEPDQVRQAVDQLEDRQVLSAQDIDEGYALELIDRYAKSLYKECLRKCGYH